MFDAPMGTLHHLFLLLALDEAITDGRISLQERIDAAAIRAYRVAGVEEGRLGERLAALGYTP